MGLFRHPHLVRGVVHTAEGAFFIHRGIAQLPDAVGESMGWQRVDEEAGDAVAPAREAAGRKPNLDHAGAA